MTAWKIATILFILGALGTVALLYATFTGNDLMVAVSGGVALTLLLSGAFAFVQGVNRDTISPAHLDED